MLDSSSGLALFNQVVRSGSFVGAADALELTPSAVSKGISRLENRLGVRLLHRSTRSLRLTEAGAELLKRSESILAAVREAEAVVTDLANEPQGELSVSCSDAFAALVIVPMLEQFQQRYPRVRVHLAQGDGPIDLLHEPFDVAVRFEVPTPRGLGITRLIDDPWVLCASPEYLEVMGQPEKPAELRHHRCLVIRARGVADDQWVFHRRRRLVVPVNPVFSGIGMVVKEAALRGLGIARLAHFLVADRLASGDLVPLLTSYAMDDGRAIYAVTPDVDRVPAKSRAFIDSLAQRFVS